MSVEQADSRYVQCGKCHGLVPKERAIEAPPEWLCRTCEPDVVTLSERRLRKLERGNDARHERRRVVSRQPKPLPPPFPVGTKVRYRGHRIGYQGKDGVVERVELGCRGTGEVIDVADDIIDVTRDGRSIVTIDGFSFAILPKYVDSWEVIP